MDARGEARQRSRTGYRYSNGGEYAAHNGEYAAHSGEYAAHKVNRRKRDRRDYRTRPTVTAVIPTLNEAENLPHVFRQLPNGVNELIVVDGHSTDETLQVTRNLRPDARIVLQDRRGKGNALACGFAAARGDIIVMVDADGSTDPTEIPTFIAPLINGADFVKGSRYMKGGGSDDITHVRSAGNRALGLSVNLLFGTSYTDLCYGYNAFWRRCLPFLHVNCDGFEVETVLNIRAARARLNVVEVPSYEHNRLHGLSNLNAWRDGRRALAAIMRERFSRLPEPSDAWRPQFAEVGDVIVPPVAPPVSVGVAPPAPVTVGVASSPLGASVIGPAAEPAISM